MLSRDSKRRLWIHLRAALVLYHVLAVLLMALPAPVYGNQRSSYRLPTVRAEIERWRGVLSAVGIDVSRTELSRIAFDLSTKILNGRKMMLLPFHWYYKVAGTRQAWRMFAGANTWPLRLQIDADLGNGLETIYLSRSAEHTFMARQLDHELMRSLLSKFSKNRKKKTWPGFVDWLGRNVAQQYPNVRQVRVTLFRAQTPSAAAARGGDEYELKVFKALDARLGATP